jgi:hypothetical protein
MIEFANDKALEEASARYFDIVYQLRWPGCVVHRFNDFSDPVQKAFQHQGIDVAVMADDGDPIEAVQRRLNGEKTCLLIDEKYTATGGLRPGLPVEELHVYDHKGAEPGWVNDPKHVADLIVYVCGATGVAHFFSAKDVKKNWRSGVDPNRSSVKDNHGIFGDYWKTTAHYVAYETFVSHKAVRFKDAVDPKERLRAAWAELRA